MSEQVDDRVPLYEALLKGAEKFRESSRAIRTALAHEPPPAGTPGYWEEVATWQDEGAALFEEISRYCRVHPLLRFIDWWGRRGGGPA